VAHAGLVTKPFLRKSGSDCPPGMHKRSAILLFRRLCPRCLLRQRRYFLAVYIAELAAAPTRRPRPQLRPSLARRKSRSTRVNRWVAGGSVGWPKKRGYVTGTVSAQIDLVGAIVASRARIKLFVFSSAEVRFPSPNPKL